MDKKEWVKNIREKEIKEEEIFNMILLDYLHSFLAHKNSEIKINSIKPTLRGIYIVWSQCGTLQRYARTIEYNKLNELTKNYQIKI